MTIITLIFCDLRGCRPCQLESAPFLANFLAN